MFKEIAAEIDDSAFEAASRLRHTLLNDFLGVGEPWTVWQWIRSIRNSRRRHALVRALRKYTENGERDGDFRYIKAFVKKELLPLFRGTPEGPWIEGKTYVARLIQAPHDETHLIAGPWLKPLVGRLKEVWGWDNWLFYASVSPEKLDKWLSRTACAVSWFWSDYSSFDATWSNQAWDLVESFYRTIYPSAGPEFWDVLAVWRTPHGKMRCRKEDLRIEYKAGVCNASGRDDTALANALLNGIVLSLSFAKVLSGKSFGDLSEDDVMRARDLVDIAVVGDDSLVACKFDCTCLMEEIQAAIRSFGLVVEANSSHSLLDVTFLGMMPYFAGGVFTWGPTVGRRLYKAFWQREPTGHLPAWTRGVARQLSLYANVPVLFDLAQRVDRLLDKQKATPIEADENRTWTQRETAAPSYDDRTIEWLAARYAKHGLTPNLIREDLKTIRSIKRLPAVVHLWTTSIAASVDDL